MVIHLAACTLYFISLQHGHDERHSWIGANYAIMESKNEVERCAARLLSAAWAGCPARLLLMRLPWGTGFPDHRLLPTGLLPTGLLPTGLLPTGLLPTGCAVMCHPQVHLQLLLGYYNI
jgi:hypothetical protein